MNKPLFESSRIVQTPPHAYNSKKVLAGLFSIAIILLLLLAMLKMPPQVRAETSITKPAVPEFSVKLIDSSYDVPTTYSVDPYTGENVAHAGYHVEQQSIEVKIKNQPFTPYEIQDSNGNNQSINFFYNIRIKGNFSVDWTELYRASDWYPHQWSDSDYTALSYVLGGDADTVLGTKMIKFPAGAQVDFQVEAMIGYTHREISIPIPGTGWIFTGETSGWSNTQTITIDANATKPSQNPTTSTPDQSGNQANLGIDLYGIAVTALVVSIVIALLAAGTMLIRRKH